MEEKQIIEVEYDKEMLEEDIKAQEENNEKLLIQDEVNTDKVEELLGEGAELNDDAEED